MNKELNAAEAVYGFVGWLTSREERTVMSAKDDCAPIAELIKRFCTENNLPEVSDQWPLNLIHPSGEVAVPNAIYPCKPDIFEETYAPKTAPVALPKPVGWFHRHPKECKNGQVYNYQIASGDRKDGWEESPVYTEQQVHALLAEVSAPAAQEMDAQLVAFIENVRDFKAQAVRVGTKEGEIRWDIEFGHYGAELRGKTLREAISKALAAQAKQGGAA